MAINKNTNSSFIIRLNQIIEENLDNEQFCVSELAKNLSLSRSQLYRKLYSATRKTASQFIREYRLKKAMDLLLMDELTAAEIAYRVGFSSPTYFNSSFNKFYGYPPGEVKHRKNNSHSKQKVLRKLVFGILTLLLIGFTTGVLFFNNNILPSSKIKNTIAVYPFTNDSENEENQYFCNGIMTAILDNLSKIPGLIVSPRISIDEHLSNRDDYKNVAKELGVNYIVIGSVQRIENRAIISTELISVEDNSVIWSAQYDKDISEIFSVQAEVSEAISVDLEVVLTEKIKKQNSKYSN